VPPPPPAPTPPPRHRRCVSLQFHSKLFQPHLALVSAPHQQQPAHAVTVELKSQLSSLLVGSNHLKVPGGVGRGGGGGGGGEISGGDICENQAVPLLAATISKYLGWGGGLMVGDHDPPSPTQYCSIRQNWVAATTLRLLRVNA